MIRNKTTQSCPTFDLCASLLLLALAALPSPFPALSSVLFPSLDPSPFPAPAFLALSLVLFPSPFPSAASSPGKQGHMCHSQNVCVMGVTLKKV
jgi:hypothetical protein